MGAADGGWEALIHRQLCSDSELHDSLSSYIIKYIKSSIRGEYQEPVAHPPSPPHHLLEFQS